MNNQHTKKEPTIESKKEMKKRLKDTPRSNHQHTMKKSNTKKRERPNS